MLSCIGKDGATCNPGLAIVDRFGLALRVSFYGMDVASAFWCLVDDSLSD